MLNENKIISCEDLLFILNEEDPYKILGIPVDASFETINQVYKTLAKKYHPDRLNHLKNKINTGQIEQIFTKITGAFNLLKEPESRKKYDHNTKMRLSWEEKQKAENNNPVSTENPADNKTVNIKDTVPANLNFSDIITRKNSNDVKERKNFQAEALFNLGLGLFKQGDYDEAINNFQAAIRIDPAIARYHTHLGLSMLKKGWRGYAEAELKVALHYDPADKLALENYNNILSKKTTELKPENKKNGFLRFFKKEL